MIYSGKTTSVKEVIAKVYRDLDLKEEASFISFLEWSAEALEKIGTFKQLDSKNEVIHINNYSGDLPDDLVYLTLVTYNNYPILPTSNSIEPIKVGTGYPKPYSPYQSKIENAVFVANQGLDFSEGSKQLNSLTYKVANGKIKVGVESGKLLLVYEAMPLDCDGYPLVPDYVEFKEAIYWYINMKYSYSQWRRGEIRDQIYKDAEQNWHWYCQQAANKAGIPDLATMENMKRSYLSLRPRVNEFQSFYNGLNSRF